MADKRDADVQAITTLVAVLEPLSPDARANVLDFVFRKLNISFPPSQVRGDLTIFDTEMPSSSSLSLTDLRSLTAEKKPKTANQMVALVAYYLANLAPSDERRENILPSDIKKYFVQAGFPLPTAPPSMTLVNAKNAGYLDATKDGYRLNPVGHNLVAHKLPAPLEGAAPARARKKKTRGKKKVRK